MYRKLKKYISNWLQWRDWDLGLEAEGENVVFFLCNYDLLEFLQ